MALFIILSSNKNNLDVSMFAISNNLKLYSW